MYNVILLHTICLFYFSITNLSRFYILYKFIVIIMKIYILSCYTINFKIHHSEVKKYTLKVFKCTASIKIPYNVIEGVNKRKKD